MRWRASVVAHALCGVIRQFLAVRSGFVGSGGSVESTSRAAPAIRPEFSAAARSASSIRGPRDVLIEVWRHLEALFGSASSIRGPRDVLIGMAVCFIIARAPALIVSRVSGVKGDVETDDVGLLEYVIERRQAGVRIAR
jgi:hypothetical protein